MSDEKNSQNNINTDSTNAYVKISQKCSMCVRYPAIPVATTTSSFLCSKCWDPAALSKKIHQLISDETGDENNKSSFSGIDMQKNGLQIGEKSFVTSGRAASMDKLRETMKTSDIGKESFNASMRRNRRDRQT